MRSYRLLLASGFLCACLLGCGKHHDQDAEAANKPSTDANQAAAQAASEKDRLGPIQGSETGGK